MKKEEKVVLQKVADYAETEKKSAVKRKCLATFIGTLVFVICIMLGYNVLPKLPKDNILRNDGLWLGLGIWGLVCLWGIVIYENHKNSE